MKAGRYIEGARNRQQILDYLNANPGKMAPEIIKDLGLDKIVGSDRLGKMYHRGELSREKAMYCGVNSAGKNFCMGTFAYTAKVTKTVGADEMLTRIAENLSSDGEASKPKKKSLPKWLTRNDNPDRKPLQNQGGQGARRREFGIQSSMA